MKRGTSSAPRGSLAEFVLSGHRSQNRRPGRDRRICPARSGSGGTILDALLRCGPCRSRHRPDVGTIRVRRIVGAYGIGRVVNPRLARSQCTGGMIGGVGMALMERTVLDARDGRPVNAHMADYLMPVNLDIPQLEAHIVDEHDPHVNPLGVKGLGEIALVGTAPAIANAVFHATGRRVRSLPIHIEDVLTASTTR
jgi:Molybdopterin-binding domain of aldehyde dehydrogenase